MALTAMDVKRLSCPEGKKQIKKSDGNGLFLLVKDNGSKLWRMRYRYNNKHQELALGSYPTIPLVEARNMTAQARALLVQGINPTDERRAKKRSAKEQGKNFEEVALAWWEKQKGPWSEDYAKKVKRWITVDAKPLAKLPIDSIDQAHLTELMLSLEKAGKRRSAGNVLSTISRIFCYARGLRYASSNPAEGVVLRDILEPMPKVKHRAAITKPLELAQLIRDVDTTDSGSYCTVEALRLIPRLFLRPNEIRLLKWEYIDFDLKRIEIPAHVMKCDREHLVPMADQVVDRLKAIKEVTGYSPYVFPNERNSDKPLSKNVMTNRLRDLGYGADVMTAHGFRSTASTMLREIEWDKKEWDKDVIETQLAHLTGTATTRAYDRAEYWGVRIKMMQAWADYLDNLVA
ncbi:MAG: integrase arm-type DNA-binding domain-containing protein [Pseudomonadota bacterium]|nr:integrase arm-type DNA-binding domain-containing protein [Pseudomonadota bacterium]